MTKAKNQKARSQQRQSVETEKARLKGYKSNMQRTKARQGEYRISCN